jgi:predicted MFS family arabinose efflux permease
VTAAGLSVCLIADTVVILAIQRRLGLSIGSFPLLFVLIGAATALASVPVGRWVDAAGPRRALLAGHVLFALTAAVIALDTGTWWWAAAVVVILGLAHAATDGVLGAYTALLARPGRETSAQGATQTAVALGRSVGALAFGLSWQQIGFTASAWIWALMAVVAVSVAWLVLPPGPRQDAEPATSPSGAEALEDAR